MRALASAVLVAAALAAPLALPRSAAAFCGFYVSGADTKLVAEASQVVLMREGTRTVLSMQNDYKGPPEDFAMVVPVPVVLQKENVKTLARDVFARIDALSAPRLVEYWEQDPCSGEGVSLDHIGTIGHGAGTGAGFGNSGGGAARVKVEAKFEVGEYDIVILSSQSSSALYDWLKDNKYKIPDDAEPMLRPYVQAGSKFFVAKVNAAKLKIENGVATLSPLRFHYDSDKFELPVRLGLVNSAGKQDLVVQILAPEKRYEVANYPNVTIPTNLDVAASARERFGDFYAALFDDTVAKAPSAVVTEYAWPASNCDPCPGGVSGLAVEDLLALGADVLPSTIAHGGVTVSVGGGWNRPSTAPVLRQSTPQVSDGLPNEVVSRIVRQSFGRLRLCYEQGLKTNPGLKGRVSLAFTIGKDGSVKNAANKGSDLPDASAVSCMVRAVSNLTFPQPEGGREVSVVFPVDLSPPMANLTPGSVGGISGLSSLPGFVLTRLHARYGKGSLGADLVFKEATPIMGGREQRTEGKLEEGSSASATNNFQARYAIRHAWPGPIKCASPRRGVWGGPSWPDAGAPSDTIAATKTAYAKRDGVTLASFLTSAEVAPAPAQPSDAGAADAGVTAASSSKCGCRTAGVPAEPTGAVALALALLVRLARRRAN